MDSFDIGSFGMVREFVEQVLMRGAPHESQSRHAPPPTVNWSAIEELISDAHTMEHAVGRALVVADQMCRGVFDGPAGYDPLSHETPPPAPVALGKMPPPPDGTPMIPAVPVDQGSIAAIRRAEVLVAPDESDPFFAFSMVDAVPDFGDESRYRTRMARKVARVLGTRRTAVTTPTAV